jgi:hypothetical protein
VSVLHVGLRFAWLIVYRRSSPWDRWAPIRLPSLIKKKAAPHPRAGIPHQSPVHGIGVHVLQFLPFLAPAVNIEVVKSGLPESRQTRVSAHEWQPQLRVRNPPLAFPQIPRDALLQRFQHHRWRNLCWLADQKMHVLRHHHVPHQQKTIPLANHFTFVGRGLCYRFDFATRTDFVLLGVFISFLTLENSASNDRIREGLLTITARSKS